jgi:hypothetical protein
VPRVHERKWSESGSTFSLVTRSCTIRLLSLLLY